MAGCHPSPAPSRQESLRSALGPLRPAWENAGRSHHLQPKLRRHGILSLSCIRAGDRILALDKGRSPWRRHAKLKHLLDQLDSGLSAFLTECGEPAYRARQVRNWLFARRAGSFEEMTDLPAGSRESLAAEFTLWTTEIAGTRQADDGTEKLLLRLADGEQIECVLLRDGDRRTICISTQVGCAHGLRLLRQRPRRRRAQSHRRRNRRADAAACSGCCPPTSGLSHIVVMGMGEPLANLDACCRRSTEASQRETAWASAPGGSRSRPSACPQAMRPPGRRGMPLSPGRLAARAERRAAQPDSCRSTRTSAWPRSWPRPTSTSTPRAGG